MEYGCGISFEAACQLGREEIVHALNGEIKVGEDEHGFIYAPGTKKETDEVIFGIYDALVFTATQWMAAERAMESAYFRKPESLGVKEPQK